jgi:hypothetical protein
VGKGKGMLLIMIGKYSKQRGSGKQAVLKEGSENRKERENRVDE